MAKHEFGILETDPKPEASYDTYEPEKYNCIAVINVDFRFELIIPFDIFVL